MKAKFWIFIGLGPLAIVLDQWTKLYVHRHFHWGESLPIISPVFAFTYVRNTGAAFGLFHKATPIFRESFFIVLPILALFALGWLFVSLEKERRLSAVALTLITCGALGNLIDRIRLGFVIDFLDVHWKEVYHWPAFNVADSCIVVGVVLMFLESMQERPYEKSGRIEPELASPSALSGQGGHAKEGNLELGNIWSKD